MAPTRIDPDLPELDYDAPEPVEDHDPSFPDPVSSDEEGFMKNMRHRLDEDTDSDDLLEYDEGDLDLNSDAEEPEADDVPSDPQPPVANPILPILPNRRNFCWAEAGLHVLHELAQLPHFGYLRNTGSVQHEGIKTLSFFFTGFSKLLRLFTTTATQEPLQSCCRPRQQ